jgi:hypothetical protein
MIPVEESFTAWRKDPEYEKAYNALENEFSLAAALLEARTRAGLTQEPLAARMQTTPACSHARKRRSNGSPRRRACGCGFPSSRHGRAEHILGTPFARPSTRRDRWLNLLR